MSFSEGHVSAPDQFWYDPWDILPRRADGSLCHRAHEHMPAGLSRDVAVVDNMSSVSCGQITI